MSLVLVVRAFILSFGWVIDNPETSTMEMLRAIDILCRMFGLYNQPTASRDERISNSTTSLALQGMTDKELQDLITTAS